MLGIRPQGNKKSLGFVLLLPLTAMRGAQSVSAERVLGGSPRSCASFLDLVYLKDKVEKVVKYRIVSDVCHLVGAEG